MLKLALTARWITGLVLCLLMAVAFALLAQWQISRTVLPNSDGSPWSKVNYVPLSSVAVPNQAFRFNEISEEKQEIVLTQVTSRLLFNSADAFLVGNRVQINGDQGYWLVVPASTPEAKLFVAVGFVAGLDKAIGALEKTRSLAVDSYLPIVGRYLPSEAPLKKVSSDYQESMSVAELINQTEVVEGEEVDPVFTGFMAITKPNVFTKSSYVETITIGAPKTDGQLNWLSAFYAIEWTVFAGFAIFMWWRLLADAYRKEQTELLASGKMG